MELRAHAATAKKLWNYLRVAFFMMRKGFASRRRLAVEMNLLMKRGKSLGRSLIFQSHHHHHRAPGKNVSALFGRREYEFSCSNSPNYPVFYHGKRHRHSYFPCLHAAVVSDDDATPWAAVVPPRIEYSPLPENFFLSSSSSQDLALGEQRTPLPSASSPFSVRVMDYPSECEEEEDGGEGEVDDEAEEFIKRFYEQLRSQSRVALLQYQEMEYQQMLARGL
ncbi:uncharacterized protein LOC122015855 [Zingiber officinale]|uniref:DUF761 domain-containing protein n=1 Tax=Zingiber officinale TaxID=94328 RepID=A0A8J5KBM4_ZINOF|nr:uncharacterized protein LOC122015855 [Zingiber officinale]KAG6480646.1 hypothetical protein ZIOFF_057231 [Zingiber officinale]